MGKRTGPKVLAQQEFPAWKTASNTTHEKIGYTKVGSSVLMSSPFNELTPTTQIVYIKLLGISHDNAGFSISYRNMTREWKVCKSSFQRALRELEKAEFIERVKPDGDGEPQFQTKIYRYVNGWKKRLTEEERKKFRGA